MTPTHIIIAIQHNILPPYETQAKTFLTFFPIASIVNKLEYTHYIGWDEDLVNAFAKPSLKTTQLPNGSYLIQNLKRNEMIYMETVTLALDTPLASIREYHKTLIPYPTETNHPLIEDIKQYLEDSRFHELFEDNTVVIPVHLDGTYAVRKGQWVEFDSQETHLIYTHPLQYALIQDAVGLQEIGHGVTNEDITSQLKELWEHPTNTLF